MADPCTYSAFVEKDAEATIIGFAAVGDKYFIQLRMGNGTTGFIRTYEADSWTGEDPKIKMTEFDAKIKREMADIEARFAKERAEREVANARRDRCIADVNKLRIGMSETDVAPMTHCLFASVNTTETAAGTRKQIVFYGDYPTWVIAYIYIEDGLVVAIQRHG